MRKLTGFVIAVLLGISGTVVFDGRTARADHNDEHAALLRSADPKLRSANPNVMYLLALYALAESNRAEYEEYKGRLKLMANYGSTDPFKGGSSTKADIARHLLDGLPAFYRENAPDYTHEGGGGEAH